MSVSLDGLTCKIDRRYVIPAAGRGARVESELIITFRTHVWNEDVAYQARRLLGFCEGATFVVLADESNGVLDTAPLEKIAHDSKR